MVQKSQEAGRKFSFVRTAYSFAYSALLASFARSAALIHSLARPLTPGKEERLDISKRPGFVPQCGSDDVSNGDDDDSTTMRVVAVRRPMIRDDPGSTSTVATTTTTVSGTSSSSVPPRATTTTTSQAAPEVDLADSLGSDSFALDGFSFHSRKDNSDESETEEFRGDDEDEDASLDGMTTIDVVTGDSVGKQGEGDGYFEDEEDSGKGPSPVGDAEEAEARDAGGGDGGRPGGGGSPTDAEVK